MISPILLIGLKFLSGDPMLWKYQAAACTLCYRESFFGSCGDLARMAIHGGMWLICLVQESPFRGIYGGHIQLRRLVKQDANHCWAVIQVQAVSFLILRDRRPQMSANSAGGLRFLWVLRGSAAAGALSGALCAGVLPGEQSESVGREKPKSAKHSHSLLRPKGMATQKGLASPHERFLHPIWSEDHRSAEANMVEVVRAWDSTASG